MIGSQKRLSKSVESQLCAISGPEVIVATVRTVLDVDVAQFADFNLSLATGRLMAGAPVLPPRARGLFAARNLDGWKEKRKDIPKESKAISTLAPSWGSGGRHLVTRTVEAWPIRHHRARLNTISATVLEQLRGGSLVRFRVDQPLNRQSATFQEDLQFNLRFLREAVGSASVFAADMTDEEFAQIQLVSWQLLPPGSVDRILSQIASRNGSTEARMRVGVCPRETRGFNHCHVD